MSRGAGRIYRRKKAGRALPTWWLDYTSGGKRFRESSGTTDRRVALAVLRERAGDRDSGKRIGIPERVTLHELRALVEKQYDLDGNRSKKRLGQAFDRLEAFFGADATVPTLTAVRLDDYKAARLAEEAKRATANYELAMLRRGFRLAIEKGLLATMPVIRTADPKNARSGFFSAGDLTALFLELPGDARRDLVEFLRWTGWRRDEGRLLQWANVDRAAETVRISQTKSGKPRAFPFKLAPELVALFKRRWEARDGVYVFHLEGQAIGEGALRSAWKRATKRAGLLGRLVHDLRRTRARELRRMLAESDIMELCGWETREMFKRYTITDEGHLEQSVGRAFGTLPAHPEASDASGAQTR